MQFHPLTAYCVVRAQTNTGVDLKTGGTTGNPIAGATEALAGMGLVTAETYTSGVAALKAMSSVASGGTFSQIGSTVNVNPGAQHRIGLMTFYPGATGPWFQIDTGTGSGTALTGQVIMILFGGRQLPTAQPTGTVDAGAAN